MRKLASVELAGCWLGISSCSGELICAFHKLAHVRNRRERASRAAWQSSIAADWPFNLPPDKWL